MAGVARTTGLGHAHAVLYTTANLGFYVVNAGGSLAAEGGIGKALELLAQAINPIAFNSEGTSGLVNIVVDDSQWDAAGLQTAIRGLGSVTGDDSTSIDLTGSDVVAATTLTVA